jgi:hypothetical protein
MFPCKQKNSTSRFTIDSVSTSDPTTITNAFCSYFSNIVYKLKTKTFALKNCIWRQQSIEPLRTCKIFKFTRVAEESVQAELRKLKKKKAAGLDDIPPSSLKDAADVLSGPLTIIINLSFKTGVFPTDWKSSKLTPVHKSGAKDCIENYRPISVIPAISKIIERMVRRQLSAYLENNNLLDDCQFGFRQNRSTELATALFTDSIKRKVNEGKLVGAVFIDLSKAFDTLSHAKLILKLRSYGILNTEIDWFQDYLFNRTQHVQVGNILSHAEKVNCGVPQGSIIGPLLFNLFYNDFSSCLKHSQVIVYADDTVIFVPGKDLSIIETRLSADMKHIHEWYAENELILNLSKGKTESMLFGTAKNLSMQRPVMNVVFGNEFIKFTTTYNYLGIKIEPNLTMNSNFDQCYKKASSRLKLIHKLRSHMTAEACAALYQAMVIPVLTYCGIVHLKKTKNQVEKSNALHERARRIIGHNYTRSMRSPERINRTKALKIVRKCIEGSIIGNLRTI